MTNWYIENNIAPALGMAVKLLGGALSQLEEAISQKNSVRIVELTSYSDKIIELYSRAIAEAPKDSLRTRRNTLVGTAMLQALDKIFNGY